MTDWAKLNGAKLNGARPSGDTVKRFVSMLFVAGCAALTASCNPVGSDARPTDGNAADEPTMATVGASEQAAKGDRTNENKPATLATTERLSPDRPTVKRTSKGKVAVRGSGVFIDEAAASRQVSVASDDGRITLNFVEAEVRDVVRTVLGGTLGLNYTIDPSTRGTITLQTSKPLRRDDVLPTLETVLRLNGVALVRTGAVYSVLPADGARRGLVSPRLRGVPAPSGEAYGMQIVPLEFASATEMARIIEPLAAPGAVLRTDTQRNLLIIAGTRRERETLLDIIDVFDVDWLTGMSFAMVPLSYANPAELILNLENVFGGEGTSPVEGVVRFYPVERRNAILVITSRPNYLEKAQQWIARLDVGDSETERLFVYRVQNGRAIDIAAILSQVFSTDGGTGAPASGRDLAPGRQSARLNSSEPDRSRGTRSRIDQNAPLSAQSVGPVLGAAQATTPSTGSTPPVRADRRAAPRPSSTTRPPPSILRAAALGTRVTDRAPSKEAPDIRIIPDDINNALVIKATPRVYQMIETAMRKLDVVPLQVLIEATIAEVSLTDELRYGVQWFFKQGSGSATFSTLASGAVSSTFPGFSYAFTKSDIRVVLDALESVTDVRVISSPQVMVLDNRTAELQVGDEVPIATQSSVSVTDPNAPVINTIQFRNTGVVLRVTPRVNASGLVTLDIDQEESSAVTTTSSGIDSPTIQQRRITSSVVVRSEETVALGGLIRDTETGRVTGIPLLSHIPIFGNLFKSTADTGRRTELIVLITPRVVRNQEEARAVTNELRRRLRDASAIVERGKRELSP